jgi:carboxymethylenebutenolidase
MKMKFAFLICLMMFSGYLARAQKSCCQPNSAAEFAMLGESRTFQNAHAAPEPILFQAKKGMMAEFDTPDGKKGKAFFVPPLVKSDKYVFVFHEWWGLNDHIKRESEALAEKLGDVNVVAIDLYDGQLATNAEDAGRIMQSVKQERAEAIIKGVIGYIRQYAVIQTIGWCFGGGWSLQAAMIAGDKAKGCVMYYGMPEKDEAKLKKFNAPVLGIFATRDGWINKPVVDEFQSKMKSLNKTATFHWYDAEHAFANPSNPKFDQKSAADAMNKSVEFIKKNFE